MDEGSNSGDGDARPDGDDAGGAPRRGRGRGRGRGSSGGGGQGAPGGGPRRGSNPRAGGGTGRPGGARGGSGGQGARGSGGGAARGPAGRGRGDEQQSPIEVAARSTRNAIRRHAESLRDDDSRLACRSFLTALVASSRGMASPAELLATIEQFGHVVENTSADAHQLQVTLRAVAAFTAETPRRLRDVVEMVRLLLRFGYVVAADHLPRSFRDDGGFRGSALADQLESIVPEYLDDTRFAELSRR